MDLFSEARPIWHADDIIASLAYSRPTVYRYVKDLVEAGFLQKVSAGRYALGVRVIELDYLLRRSDPLLIVGASVMNRLAVETGLYVILSAMYGDKVIDIHSVGGDPGLTLGFRRGQPRPLFAGAAPKMLLAFGARATARRLYEAHAEEVAQRGLGAGWPEFRAHLALWRKRAVYHSRGEAERGVAGLAVPLLDRSGVAVAALSLVGALSRLTVEREPDLIARLERARQEIEPRLA